MSRKPIFFDPTGKRSRLLLRLAWGLGTISGLVMALFVATYTTQALVMLGALATGFGLQMWPTLIAVCWWPWLTRQGATAGLFCGLLAVMCTENILAQYMPWGRYPLTIHSAGWGVFVNLLVSILVSAVTQDSKALAHRMTYHNFLREHASLSASKRGLVPVAWIVTLAWFFFGIGPGAVIGNWIFGDPKIQESWIFGIPSIWAWQILWWALGIGMMWLLAYKMELSIVPHKEVEALVDDIGDRTVAAS